MKRNCQMNGCPNEGTIAVDMGVSHWKEPWYFCNKCYDVSKMQFTDCSHIKVKEPNWMMKGK